MARAGAAGLGLDHPLNDLAASAEDEDVFHGFYSWFLKKGTTCAMAMATGSGLSYRS